ncbi:hypothetical protein SMMN14_09368 [Sphaerulina musiva]
MNRYRFGGPSKATATTLCQKCLKRGHYTYECTSAQQDRPYTSRPSRSQQLSNPKLAPKLSAGSSGPGSPSEWQEFQADEQASEVEFDSFSGLSILLFHQQIAFKLSHAASCLKSTGSKKKPVYEQISHSLSRSTYHITASSFYTSRQAQERVSGSISPIGTQQVSRTSAEGSLHRGQISTQRLAMTKAMNG